MDRGGHQHALAVLARQLEHRAAHVGAGGVVQQAVLAPAGSDVQLVLTDPVVDFVGEHPGGVDHRPGGKVPLAGVDHPALPGPFQAGDLGVEGELHPVFSGALRQAQGQLEGAHNARGVGKQGPLHLLREVGLQSPGLLPGEQLHVRHAVCHAPVVELPQLGQLLLGEAHHKGPHPPEGDVQLLAERIHALVARHIHLRFPGAGLRVEPSVHNGGVCLAGALTHIQGALHHQEAALPAGELPGHGGAHHTGAHHNGIVLFHSFSPPIPFQPAQAIPGPERFL